MVKTRTTATAQMDRLLTPFAHLLSEARRFAGARAERRVTVEIPPDTTLVVRPGRRTALAPATASADRTDVALAIQRNAARRAYR
ncbi:MAG: hypothetical protein ACYTGR_08660 [Planctomycetota bacterium]|jgi:hypothetical protein